MQSGLWGVHYDPPPKNQLIDYDNWTHKQTDFFPKPLLQEGISTVKNQSQLIFIQYVVFISMNSFQHFEAALIPVMYQVYIPLAEYILFS